MNDVSSESETQPDGGETREVVYTTDDEHEHKSALNELLFEENTHVMDVMIWTAGVALTMWAVGYAYAMKDVAERTPVTWSELMTALPVNLPVAVAVLGVFAFVMIAAVALLHSLEEDDADD